MLRLIRIYTRWQNLLTSLCKKYVNNLELGLYRFTKANLYLFSCAGSKMLFIKRNRSLYIFTPLQYSTVQFTTLTSALVSLIIISFAHTSNIAQKNTTFWDIFRLLTLLIILWSSIKSEFNVIFIVRMPAGYWDD